MSKKGETRMKLLNISQLLLGLLLGTQVAAADIRPFSQQIFEQLQAEGQPVLVDVYADWCPVCLRQEAVLAPMLDEPALARLVMLRLNFDTQQAALKRLGVNRQSTLLLFDEGREIGRVLGETDAGRLRLFIERIH
jgi:thioredoxin 1